MGVEPTSGLAQDGNVGTVGAPPQTLSICWNITLMIEPTIHTDHKEKIEQTYFLYCEVATSYTILHIGSVNKGLCAIRFVATVT